MGRSDASSILAQSRRFLISSVLIFLRAVGAFCLNFQCLRCILSAGIFRRSFPGYGWSIVMSIVALGCSLLCGIFYNNPGKLLGIGGSITGVYYAFCKLKYCNNTLIEPYSSGGLVRLEAIRLVHPRALVRLRTIQPSCYFQHRSFGFSTARYFWRLPVNCQLK